MEWKPIDTVPSDHGVLVTDGKNIYIGKAYTFPRPVFLGVNIATGEVGGKMSQMTGWSFIPKKNVTADEKSTIR